VLVATGSEVGLAIAAAKLFGGSARVVSMPCVTEFLRQDTSYRTSVLPAGIALLAVEAAASAGWSSVVHYVHGIDRFGVSAPGADAFKDCGMTPDNVLGTMRKLLARFPAGHAPSVGPL